MLRVVVVMNTETLTAKDLFIELVSHVPPEQWNERLEQACPGNDDLQSRVRALLRAHAEPGSFLERPAMADEATADQASPLAERPGTVIGPYKLLQQIGEGGMGVVFMAEQDRPVRRKVALKVIKPGMDTRQVIGRFDAERQALAMMDHPNIAKVLDAGATENGRPYFVMELVQGVPITEYCDQCNLTTRERLELFITVCQAVQHAHQKGVIHRDIKPTNVLVAIQDGKPAPKIIDFGVAKAIDQRLTERTLTNAFAQMVGTPLYMSPEQAELSPLGVDTRSDIYSLGVLLYELLTGTTPFHKDRLHAAPYDVLRRIIREEAPPRPSARLSTLAADLATTIAEQRRTEPRRLTQQVRGELDWIVMKCLEKDRNRRYETADSLARDVEHYLADKPVQACPPSAAYRLRKFARRNKGPVLAVSLVLLVLVAGIVGTTWQAIRAANRAEGERLAKERAETNFNLANEAVEEYLGTVTNDPDLKRADFHLLRKKLLEGALPFFEKIAQQKSDDPEVEARRGRAYMRLGSLRLSLGENQTAVEDFEAARAIFARLSGDSPEAPEYRQNLAGSHRNRAIALNRLGKNAEAEGAYRQALDIYGHLVTEYPKEPKYQVGLAEVHNDLGSLLRELRRTEQAEQAYRDALRIREKLHKDSPTVPEYRRHLAGIYNDLFVLLLDQGKYDEAKTVGDPAVELLEKLVAEFDEPELRQGLATLLMNLGNMLFELGKPQAADAAYRKALDIQQKLVADFRTVPHYRDRLAGIHRNLGLHALLGRGNLLNAEESFRESLGIWEKLSTDLPTVPEYLRHRASSHGDLADLKYRQENWAASEDQRRQAISLFADLVNVFPEAPDYRFELATNRGKLGLVLNRRGQRTDAIDAHKLAIEDLQILTEKYRNVPDYTVQLGGNLCNLGLHILNDGRPEDALEWFARAIQTLTPFVNQDPRVVPAREFLRNSHYNRALALMALKRFADAVPDWDRVIALDDGPDWPMPRMWRAHCLAHVAPERAVADAEEVIQDPKLPSTIFYQAARVCAVASATVKDAQKREQFAARAVALLQEARARGNFLDKSNLEGLTSDSGLDSLREREDFKKLLAELEDKRK
ncbi:MAG TPA: serine/threonine-protein kinase [Lacipirellulaceae bacterium]